MANYIDLIINDPVNARLDLDSEVNIGIQYSIADVRDISKRNAAYSKTIILPGTKTNNFWFGNLFDVNADFTSFNPNRKTDCKLLVNSETVLDGFLQLRKINKLANVDQSGNHIQYEVVIFNNAVDLMTTLGEKTINQLNLNEYGHTFSVASVTQSWLHDYTDGYVYPMYGLNNNYSAAGANDYSVSDFWPGMFYWTLLDRTLWEAGFGWTGSLKTNEQFKKEVITYVSDGRPKISEDERRRREFRVGPTSSTLLMGTFTGGVTAANSNQTFGPTYSPLTNETNPDFYDNDTNWDTTTYQWELDVNGAFSGDYRLKGTFSLYNATGATISAVYPSVAGGGVGNDRSISYKIKSQVKYLRVGQTIPSTWTVGDSVSGFWQLFNTFGSPIKSATFSPAQEAPVIAFDLTETLPTLQNISGGAQAALQIGDKVWLEVSVSKYSNTAGTYWNGNLQARINFDTNVSYFKNTAITAELTQGDRINLAEYLPDKIKQKDLITDLITRYNLYITIDPDNDRLLVMDPRPDYYDGGDVLDWTSKKDFSSEDNIELLSELQFKEMLFSWTQDEDEYNKGYEFATGDVWGQYKYVFDNDFVKGAKTIKSPFSPTPVIFNELIGAHLPAIVKGAPKIKPRILLWGGLLDTDGQTWTLDYQNITTGGGNSVIYNQYPYAGHFDHPTQPSIDLNFGTCKYYLYNNYDYITNNNMYNTYWSNYISQIEEGRLVTSKFALNEYDIRYIKENFNSKIFVDGAYYYINKIVDYNPMNNDVTTVELIKIVEGLTWEGQKFGTSIGLTAIGPVRPTVGPMGPVLDPVGPIRPVRPVKDFGFRNRIGEGGVILGGYGNIAGGYRYDTSDTYNFKYPNNQFIIGNNNELSSDNTSVYFGDNNTVLGSNVSLFNSDNNYISDLTENITLIQASGLTVSESNTIYLGNSFSVNIETGNISGGSFNPSGPMGLTYGNATTPSLYWVDNFAAGLWKNSSSERGFNAGVLGVTISSWSNSGMDMNDKRLTNFNLFTVYTQTNPYPLQTNDMVVVMSGTATGMTASLPVSPSTGRMYIIKNVNPNQVVVATGTSSHVIDEVNTTLILDQYDSVSLIYATTNKWVIV